MTTISLPYSRRLFIQRIRKYVTNDRVTDDAFQTSDNEILLMVDAAAATRLIGQVYNGAKVEGAIAVPEAYYTTYMLPALQQDNIMKDWFTTLPQPPTSLPLGYSIARCFFANASQGQSEEILPIKSKRVGFRNLMPFPTGARYSVQGNLIRIASNNGSSLTNQQVYVEQATARTTDWDAVMGMPEDDLEAVFNEVVKSLLQRYSVPYDQVQDNLPTGAKPL